MATPLSPLALSSRAPILCVANADFESDAAMASTSEATTPRKRGRPRKAFDDLSTRGKQNRRKIDPDSHPMPIIAARASRPIKEKKKRGRPLKPYARLSKEGRKTRKYRARLAALGEERLLSPLLAAAAVVDHEEAARQEAEEAERVEAERVRRMRALERNLAEPGFRSAALMLRAAAQVDEIECPICLDSTTHSMRCCGRPMCAACLGEWLRRNGQPTEVGYDDAAFYVPVHGESEMRACRAHAVGGQYTGRAIRIPMDTHRCPHGCGARVQSLRRGLV